MVTWQNASRKKRCCQVTHRTFNSSFIYSIGMAKETATKRSALADVVTRECTVHLHKHVHGKYVLPIHSTYNTLILTPNPSRSFKKRAPTAVKAIKEFAEKLMGTKDVRLDPKLNKAVWSKGIKNVPHRIRVRLSRRRNDDEEATEKLYTYVSHVPVISFKGTF
jgi:large subunit ribosomal protein L31e